MDNSQEPVSFRVMLEYTYYNLWTERLWSAVSMQQDGIATNTITLYEPGPKRVTKNIQDLTPENCRQFCWKDCALYNTTHESPRNGLSKCVFQQWFPHRDMSKDLSLGSYACKLISADATDVFGIARMHASLCNRVTSLREEMSDFQRYPYDWNYQPGFVGTNIQGDVSFELRSTFPVIFIVVDRADWNEEGVLVVCQADATVDALELGDQALKERVVRPEGTVITIRVSLERALYAIATVHDKERVVRHTSQYFDEELGPNAVVKPGVY